MQEYSRLFAREYLPELRQELGLTESTAVWIKNTKSCSCQVLIISINNLQWAALLMSFWRHQFNMTKFSLNLGNSSWLWWIMRVVLTNPKRGNILNGLLQVCHVPFSWGLSGCNLAPSSCLWLFMLCLTKEILQRHGNYVNIMPLLFTMLYT